MAKSKWKQKRRFLFPLIQADNIAHAYREIAEAQEGLRKLGIEHHDIVIKGKAPIRRGSVFKAELTFNKGQRGKVNFTGNLDELIARLRERAQAYRKSPFIGTVRRALAGPRANYRLWRLKRHTKRKKK